MAITLLQARTIVADHLDDAGNDRWSTSQIDTGLAYALDTCTKEYVASGGDRLYAVLATSTAIDGTVDMSTVNPQAIAALALVIGTRLFPLSETRYEDRGLNDSQARSVQIRYVPTYTLPTNTAHPIVGNGAAAAKTFDTLDHWICTRAALFCSIKDADMRPELQKLEQQMASTVADVPAIPKSTAFPDRPHWYANWFWWAWKPDEQKIQLSRRGWF